MSGINYVVVVFLTLSISGSAYSDQIYKYKDQNGKTSYSNITGNKPDTEEIEVISNKKSSTSTKSDELINFQIENLFNDSMNQESELLSRLKSDRSDLFQLLDLYERQREDIQFELNANTITLERCYLNPVYDYLMLLCSGLEFKQQRLLNELDILSNQIDRLRFQIADIDREINGFQNQTTSIVCEVTKVLRGDTFECAFSTGTRVVKLIGIETPDANDNLKSSPSDFTESLILGKRVILTFDGQKTDSYNRLLAYVYLNEETMLNAMLLRQGYGFAVSYSPYRFVNEFRRYENLAKESNVGLWGFD